MSPHIRAEVYAQIEQTKTWAGSALFPYTCIYKNIEIEMTAYAIPIKQVFPF